MCCESAAIDVRLIGNGRQRRFCIQSFILKIEKRSEFRSDHDQVLDLLVFPVERLLRSFPGDPAAF
jgi:hypothetical protein